MTDPRSETVIRAAQTDDAAAITAIRALPGVRHGTLCLPFPSEEPARKMIESLTKDGLYIVAERSGAIVGYAFLRRHPGRRNHCGELALAVHDDHRGQGIGTALIAALIDAADRWLGLLRLELGVNCDNEAALAIYRRFGFVIEGRQIGDVFRDGAYIDSYAMARLSGALAGRATPDEAAPAREQ